MNFWLPITVAIFAQIIVSVSAPKPWSAAMGFATYVVVYGIARVLIVLEDIKERL
jgi:hypothetical protein